MSDRELLRKIFGIMSNLLLIPYGGCGQIAPRKGTTRRECYRALYEIQELIGSRRHFLPKPITNADRIRAMTDEELYTFLNAFVTHQEDVWCPYKDDCGTLLGQGHRTMDCRDCINDWLKKEVDDG